MERLASAVLISLDPGRDPALRKQAYDYCQNLRNSKDGWAFVLENLSAAMRPEVAFWCLGVIQETLDDPSRYPVLFSADQVAAIRVKILEYFSIATYPERYTNGTTEVEPRRFTNFLLNKLAQVVVSLIAADYPQTWGNAFHDTIFPLADSAATASSTIMFFRLLRTLDEDVTSIRATQINENKRKTSIRVKDAMRDDCIVELVGKCTVLLSVPNFTSSAFDILGRYVEWVDIGLIAHEEILSPMYAAITFPTYRDARPAAAAALRAIVLKRMEGTAKIELMKALKIETLLRSIPIKQICANEEELGDPELPTQSGQVEVAALVNTTAVVALDILKEILKGKSLQQDSGKVASEAGAIAQVALPVALGFLNESVDQETSSQILKCVTTYVTVFSRATRSDGSRTPGDGISAMVAILKAVEERALIPKEFDPQDIEKDHPFAELRAVLLKSVFRSVVRAFGELCLDFMKNLFAKASASGDVPRIELAFAMLLVFLTESPETPDVNDLQQKVIENPPNCMKFGTDVAVESLDKLQRVQKHQLELVSQTYFALVARSSRLFLRQDDTTLLTAVLPVFFDERGLGHRSSEAVRSCAAHSLLKLTRPLRYMISKNHLEAILRAVQVYMFPLADNMKALSDQLLVFETTGYLLGTDVRWKESIQYLSAILQPLLRGLQTNIGDDAVAYIMAAASLSKGFGGDSRPLLLLRESEQPDSPDSSSDAAMNGGSSGREVNSQRATPLALDLQRMWIACLEAVLMSSEPCLELSTRHVELRSKLLGFLHRMVDTIGAAVLPYFDKLLPELLNTSSTPVELRDVMIVVSQVVTKFGAASETVAGHVYVPIVEKVHQHSFDLDPKTMQAVSEESRETVEMHRAYTYFLHALMRTKLIELLVLPNHLPLLQRVMVSLLASALGEALDSRVAASVMKMSLHMLGQMVKRWAVPQADESGKSGPPGFQEFALKQISNAAVMSGVQGTVFRFGDYESGQALAVLTEIVTLQRTCASHLGQAFAKALQAGPWSTLPQEKVNAYLSALFSSDTPVASLVPAVATLSKMVRRS